MTAFVSHHDCSRHDTGWRQPDHQGRLPALVRAVYRDMLTLHDRVLQIEGRHATVAELDRVHTLAYVWSVRAAAEQAAAAQTAQRFAETIPVSGASWDAALAAAGTAIRGVEAVLSGEAANAFCATRPPGRGATAVAPGPFSLFNNVAIAARAALLHPAVRRVLIVDSAATPAAGTASIFADSATVRVLALSSPSPATPSHAALAAGAGIDDVRSVLAGLLNTLGTEFMPDLLLWSVSFDMLRADPLGTWVLDPPDYHALTQDVRGFVDQVCGGRLVTVLEGGWAATETAVAVVQHLRALAGLPPA